MKVEVTTGAGVERFEAPIVEDEELDAGETAQDAGIAAVTAGERKFGEELGNPLIENRAVVAASLVTEGTSQPRFAHAGRAREILPKNSRSTFLSIIGITRGLANASVWCVGCCVVEVATLSSTSWMAHAACCQPGWPNPGPRRSPR